MTDPVSDLVDAVGVLDKALPDLIEACDDSDAVGLASLLLDVREAREQLAQLESTIERATGKAMFDDLLVVEGQLRAERCRTRDRREWRHEDWQRDVRQKVLRKFGLLHVQVLAMGGELLDEGVLFAALQETQRAHGAGQPKTTVLRTLGLDGADYCSITPGPTHVKVARTEGAAPESVAS